MTDSERAWLAGWLEGEGTFQLRIQDGRPYFAVVASSTDDDVLAHVKQLAGGRIYPAQQRSARHRPVWVWRLGCRPQVLALVQELRPLMHARRGEAIDRMVRAALDSPPSAAGRPCNP